MWGALISIWGTLIHMHHTDDEEWPLVDADVKRQWADGNFDTGEFIAVEVSNERQAASFKRLRDRAKELERHIVKQTERVHNRYHVDIVPMTKSWEDCGMVSCRISRSVLGELWWED